MVQFTDSLTLRAGATPLTFDGGGTFRINGDGRRVTGLSVSHSVSISTAAEGFAMAVRLSDNQALGSKNPVFFMGMIQQVNVETNMSAGYVAVDHMPLNIPIKPNTTVTIDITTIAGSTQTGTHDTRWTLHYDQGDTPQEILNAAAGKKGVAPVMGGTYGTLAALTDTARTALVGNGSTLNIPAEAKEIIAIAVIQVLDTAYTASQELGGFVQLEFSGISNAGKQEFPSNGGRPGLGTEVDSGEVGLPGFLPMFIKGTGQEIQTSGFINALSAISGGADWAVNILWR